MFKSLFKKLGYVPQIKSAFYPNDSSTVVTIDQFTSNLVYNANYMQLAKEGYIENVISSTCISRTAAAIADLPFDIFIDGKDIADRTDRLAMSLKRVTRMPTPDYDWHEFMTAVSSYQPIAGRSYIYPNMEGVGELPLTLEYFRPDRVSIINTDDDRVFEYQYNNGSRRQIFPRDEEGFFDLIDLKNFNPLSDIQGLSDVVVAGLAIDSHTEANKYNKQIVQNGAKPSGMITLQGDENSGQLDAAEVKVLKDRMNQQLKAKNGGIFVFDMPAKFEAMNFTNSEMDWLNGIKANAISICNAFNFPPHLLGLESTTFNNIDSAKLEFYTQAVVPKGKKILNAIANFYSRKLGQDIEFRIDKKKVLELAPLFREMRKEAREDFAIGLISQNEGREELDREPVPLGDDIFVDQNNQPMNQPIEG